MSNINRAVTRTRRAAPGGGGVSPAVRKTLALAQLHRQMYPPFTVTRPAPSTFAGMRQPMRSEQRVYNYRAQRNPARAGALQSSYPDLVVRLTPAQLRRAAKQARRHLAEWELIRALGEDYARELGWEW